MRFPYRKVHFVGIGGIGMSALARVLLTLGVEVTGSDIAEGANVQQLRSLGVRVSVPHSGDAVGEDVELVVYSSAIPQDNVELVKARTLGIPLMKRGELLAKLASQKRSAVVAGSHGKTTTTALLGKVLWSAGLSPTIVVGGRLMDFESTNALIGSGDLIVAESDESDGSFLMLSPYLGVLTNVDREHLNHYGGFEALKRAFREYLERIRGYRVVCGDDREARSLSSGLDALYYGMGAGCDVWAEGARSTDGGVRFLCHTPWGRGEVFVRLFGSHNIRNALAALASACLLGVSFEDAVEGISGFTGVERRLTVRGSFNGALLVDDYAHHPTEIVNTIEAARIRWPGRRMVVVFQPHRYSRMKALWREFLGAFDGADELWVTDVYPAGEKPNGFRIEEFLRHLSSRRPVSYFSTWREMVEPLASLLTERDVLITMGAGDVWRLCYSLMELSPERTSP